MTRTETLSKLKNVVESAKGLKPVVEEIKQVPETIQEVAEVTEETATIQNIEEQSKQPQTVIEPTDESAGLNLFDEMKTKTEEDSKPQNDKSKIEKIAEDFKENDIDEEDLNEEEDSKEFRREMANIKATGIVEFADLIICLICMAISGDWSKEAQEKKYTLTPTRKKVLVVSIMKIMIARKTKTNPTASIVAVALASFVPMIFLAVMARRNKKEEEAKTKAEVLRQQQLEQQQMAYFERQQKIQHSDFMQNHLPQKQIIKPVVKKEAGAKGKQGRHKKNCAYYLGKKCNCK